MTEATPRVEGLRAGYGRESVLAEISLSIEPGQWYALLGPNGCGKSTLLDCVVGRLRPAGGQCLEIDASAKGLAHRQALTPTWPRRLAASTAQGML